MFDGCVFQQSAFHAPPVTDLFLYLYEADFIHGVLKNFMHCYIDDVLSLNNFNFCDFVDHTYIELEKKGTTDTAMSVSFLDLHLEIDSEPRVRRNFSIKEMISIFPL
jgi:hypothetical protein